MIALKALKTIGPLLALATLSGCGRPHTTGLPCSTSDERSALVTFADHRCITARGVEKELAAQDRFVKLRFGSPARRRAFVESLVDRETLVLEGERLGLGNTVEVLGPVKDALAAQALDSVAAKRLTFAKISDEAALAHYRQHRGEYVDDRGTPRLFDLVKEQIKNELFRRAKEQLTKRYTSEQVAKSRVDINQAALAELRGQP